MKLDPAKRAHYDAGPNMTPLVDVVMVILIFLMLAGSFTGAEHYLLSNLPMSQRGAGGAKPPPGFVPEEPLEIRVDSPTPDRFVATAGKITTDDMRKLAGALTQLRQKLNADHPEDPDTKTQIIIAPGREVRYGFLIQVYEAALNAKFTRVGFAQGH